MRKAFTQNCYLFNTMLLIGMLASGCSNNPTDDESTRTTADSATVISKGFQHPEPVGDKVYGGTFRMSNTEPIQSLYPGKLLDVASANVASLVMESLVTFDPKTLEILPGLAESWKISDDGLVYSFHLRKGVLFHDDPCFPGGKGRELKASDVQYSFELLCTAGPDNMMFSSTFKDKLKGANEFYESGVEGNPIKHIEGIQVIGDYDINLTLTAPHNSFLYILAYAVASIIPREAVVQYGVKTYVGTGPFHLLKGTEIDTVKCVLVRNEHYYGVDTLGNKLPFLDTVEVYTFDTKQEQLAAFKNGALDVVDGLPSASIKDIVEEQIANFQSRPPKYILDRVAELGTNWYMFNLKTAAFKDKKVRQAFNYAINREHIVNDVLYGEAFGPGHNGFCPPAFKDYDVSLIKGYSYDPEKARRLMAAAGYTGGKSFPTVHLELNSGGKKNTSVAFEIQKELMDNLGINVDLTVVPFGQKLEDERYGRADLFRTAWIADYPSPESFLMLFYGKSVPESLDEPSYPNSARYVNPKFDALFEAAIRSSDREKSYELFLKAENILMDDAALIVLWYNENYKLLQSDIRSYHSNPLGYMSLNNVYRKAMTDNTTTDIK